MLIGAGVGALSSAAMGKSPFTGALLGGATGGAFGGAGGFGSGFAGDAGGLLSNLQGVATTPVSMGTGGFASGIGNQVIPNIAANVAPIASSVGSVPFGSTEFISPYTKEGIANFADGTTSTLSPDYLSSGVNYGASSPNFTPVLGKSADYTGGGAGSGGLFGSVKDMFGGLSTSDKVGLGMKGLDIAMRPEERMPPPEVMPIRQGNPALVSTPLYNVAPNVGRQAGNEIGLPNLLSRMPLTEEEKAQLARLNQRY